MEASKLLMIVMLEVNCVSNGWFLYMMELAHEETSRVFCRAPLGLGKQGCVDLRRVLQHPPRSGATQLSSQASDSFLLAPLSAAGE